MPAALLAVVLLVNALPYSIAFGAGPSLFSMPRSAAQLHKFSPRLRMSGNVEFGALAEPVAASSKIDRRLFGKVALATLSQLPCIAGSSAEEQPASAAPALKSEKKYSGPTAYGFSFYYPASWKPNKKPGNKHLYDLEIKPAGGKGQISMTVDAVKINKIEEYGTLQEVQERLQKQVEKLVKDKPVKIEKSEQRTTSDKMTYYTVVLSWDGYQQWTTLAATANQLFALTSLVPGEAAEYAGAALAASVQSLKVKPNTMDNFQQYGKGQAPGVLEYVKQIPGEFTRIESGEF